MNGRTLEVGRDTGAVIGIALGRLPDQLRAGLQSGRAGTLSFRLMLASVHSAGLATLARKHRAHREDVGYFQYDVHGSP